MEIHHTATHLLNSALRHILAKDISQAGSLVESDRLRFDFTNPHPITPAQIVQIEDWINNISRMNLKTTTKVELKINE